jgi:cysteine synthase A
MAKLGLEHEVVDEDVRRKTAGHFAEVGITLPTFSQLRDPSTIPDEIQSKLADVDPDAPHPLNLFRVHWFNGRDRKTRVAVPEYLVLPSELTGVKAKIVVALGAFFPMITAHKVLAAYGCIAPRLVTGQFDPTVHKALWPSTGNYCRGGVAISRILDCHGVAILPEGMSAERFQWLENWVVAPEDIVRTPGSESNVKEIYDKCAELDQDPSHIIFNQFCEFGNTVVHHHCTGHALETVFQDLQKDSPQLQLRAFTSATGSAGTIAAGDYLKEQFGSLTVAVEALECPTLLCNGFGEHNIQGIGDKHIPLIHNVMNSDLVAGISDESTDQLGVLFNTEAGRKYLVERKGLSPDFVADLQYLGLSSICNILAAIKTAKYFDYGEDDVLITVATDGYSLYGTEREIAMKSYFPGGFDAVSAGEVFGQHMAGVGIDHLQELSHQDRNRIFNLGYYTWVEQQGISLPEFEARRSQSFWKGLQDLFPAWDEGIRSFNKATVGV